MHWFGCINKPSEHERLACVSRTQISFGGTRFKFMNCFITDNFVLYTIFRVKLHVHKPIFSADFVLVNVGIADCKIGRVSRLFLFPPSH